MKIGNSQYREGTAVRISPRSGSVLILSLWALLLLSAAVFAWLKFINLNITVTGDRNNGLEAKALAHSGVMVGLNPQVTQMTPLLTQQLAPDRSYQARITGEGGRLDLNWLFTPPTNPDAGKLALFQRYLTRRGLNLEQQEHLVDSILYWLGPNKQTGRLNAAVDDETYHPPHRGAFFSVEELAQVKGSEPLVIQPDWQDDFTIYTNQGIDLQFAPLRILECLPNVGEASAIRLLHVRQGPDGVDGTADDHIFANINEAISYLGFGSGSPQAQQLGAFVYLENPMVTVHIESIGTCGNVTRRVEVVAKKMNLQPIILSWKEL